MADVAEHPHNFENEEILSDQLVPYGTFFLEGGEVTLYAYRVRCRLCGVEYLVPVGQ